MQLHPSTINRPLIPTTPHHFLLSLPRSLSSSSSSSISSTTSISIFIHTFMDNDLKNPYASSSSSSYSLHNPNPPPTKKPKFDATTTNARPCSECGKKFSSWKALFGHMRCHPERQWRGINPPPNLLLQSHHHHHHRDDLEVASSLLLLANGPPPPPPPPAVALTDHHINLQLGHIYDPSAITSSGTTRFECSGCKKVFGSHQALGGHRASHKNVKGCFAITTTTSSSTKRSEDMSTIVLDNEDIAGLVLGSGGGGDHKCSICLRVFSSGQALGGHMRCHWDNNKKLLQDDFMEHLSTSFTPPVAGAAVFDLNLPPPTTIPLPPPPPHDDVDVEDNTTDLDLRLGV